ncbi:MAG: hypothetical protein ABIE36_00675 [Candidatus Diapherotrites archaeon]
MDKDQLQKQKSEKPCFGTKEWSKTSGICRGCGLKDSCGKIQANKE